MQPIYRMQFSNRAATSISCGGLGCSMLRLGCVVWRLKCSYQKNGDVNVPRAVRLGQSYLQRRNPGIFRVRAVVYVTKATFADERPFSQFSRVNSKPFHACVQQANKAVTLTVFGWNSHSTLHHSCLHRPSAVALQIAYGTPIGWR